MHDPAYSNLNSITLTNTAELQSITFAIQVAIYGGVVIATQIAIIATWIEDKSWTVMNATPRVQDIPHLIQRGLSHKGTKSTKTKEGS